MLFYLFGADIAHYLWYYVLTPGNLLNALLALFTPYLVRFHLLPFIYHPYRYGGIPFTAPSFFEHQSMYYICILMIISICYFISSYMATLKICRQSNYQIATFNYRKLLTMLILCLIILIIFPIAKIPLLTYMIMLPYANEAVNGIFWAIFTFIGVAWSNRTNIYQVCGI